MKILKIKMLVLLVVITSANLFSQTDREWWTALSSGWKKVFQAQELKGKDITPNDEQLERIVKITYLDCSYNTDIEDLKPLAKLILLEELRCNNTKIKGLEGLEKLQNLKVLDCSNNDNINSLTPISEVTSLRELKCGNTMIKNLAPLKNLKNLKVLDVHYSTVNKLIVISELKNLEKLDVSQNLPLFDIIGVEGLTNLLEFNCSETRVNDLTPLQNLKFLEVLNVSNTTVGTLRPLQNVKTLKELDFSNTSVTSVSLDYLYTHISLTMLRGRETNTTEKDVTSFQSIYSKKNPNCTIIITPKTE